jgi:hypothetical protein
MSPYEIKDKIMALEIRIKQATEYPVHTEPEAIIKKKAMLAMEDHRRDLERIYSKMLH